MRDRKKNGTSTVEMAIVLPLLILLTFGIGEMGIMFTRWQALSTGTREGARLGVIFRVPCNAGTVTTQVQNTVQNVYVAGAGNTLTPVVTVAGACGGTGTPLTVTASATHTFGILQTVGGLAAVPMQATTTMRNE
jgi:Flp pilus assembly protein TadG